MKNLYVLLTLACACSLYPISDVYVAKITKKYPGKKAEIQEIVGKINIYEKLIEAEEKRSPRNIEHITSARKNIEKFKKQLGDLTEYDIEEDWELI